MSLTLEDATDDALGEFRRNLPGTRILRASVKEEATKFIVTIYAERMTPGRFEYCKESK